MIVTIIVFYHAHWILFRDYSAKTPGKRLRDQLMVTQYWELIEGPVDHSPTWWLAFEMLLSTTFIHVGRSVQFEIGPISEEQRASPCPTLHSLTVNLSVESRSGLSHDVSHFHPNMVKPLPGVIAVRGQSSATWHRAYLTLHTSLCHCKPHYCLSLFSHWFVGCQSYFLLSFCLSDRQTKRALHPSLPPSFPSMLISLSWVSFMLGSQRVWSPQATWPCSWDLD